MRRILAVLVDVGAVALLGYLAFRLGETTAACKDPGTCPQLTPLILFFLVLALLLYFGLPALLWRSTLGERTFLEGQSGSQHD